MAEEQVQQAEQEAPQIGTAESNPWIQQLQEGFDVAPPEQGASEGQQPKPQETQDSQEDEFKGMHGGRINSREDAERHISQKDSLISKQAEELKQIRERMAFLEGRTQQLSETHQPPQQPQGPTLPPVIPDAVLKQALEEGKPEVVAEYVNSRFKLFSHIMNSALTNLDSRIKSQIEERVTPVEDRALLSELDSDWRKEAAQFQQQVSNLPPDVISKLEEDYVNFTVNIHQQNIDPRTGRYVSRPPSQEQIRTYYFGMVMPQIMSQMGQQAPAGPNQRTINKEQFARNMAPSPSVNPRQPSAQTEKQRALSQGLSDIVNGNY